MAGTEEERVQTGPENTEAGTLAEDFGGRPGFQITGDPAMPEDEPVPEGDKEEGPVREVKPPAASPERKYKTHEEYYIDGGGFLPLSVWTTRGFNVDNIEAKSATEDKKLHNVFGMTYRVKILSKGNNGTQGSKRSSQAQANAPKTKVQAIA